MGQPSFESDAPQQAEASALASLAEGPNVNAPKPGTRAADLPPEAIALATRLFDSARAGDTATLKQYVEAGIPANLTNGSGDTLLMLAAYHNHSDSVGQLLELGADPNALNDKGQSPLAGAVFKGHVEVVRVLVEQGKADVDKGQPSAVDCARMFRRDDLLQILARPS